MKMTIMFFEARPPDPGSAFADERMAIAVRCAAHSNYLKIVCDVRCAQSPLPRSVERVKPLPLVTFHSDSPPAGKASQLRPHSVLGGCSVRVSVTLHFVHP